MHRLHKKFGRLAVWIMTFSTTGLSPLSQETLPEQPALPRLKEVSERIVEKVSHLSAQGSGACGAARYFNRVSGHR